MTIGRILLAIAGAALLSGCSSLGDHSCRTIAESGACAPKPKAVEVEKAEEPMAVERWTRKQRECEVGDRDDQSRCVMGYPD